MKRVLYPLICATVLVASQAQAAAPTRKPKKKVRTVTITYQVGPTVRTPAVNGGLCEASGVPTASCTAIPLRPDEEYISIAGKDATGQPVPIVWHPGSMPGMDSDNGYSSAREACGNDAARIRRPAQIMVYVSITLPECPVATTGSLTVTISNAP